MDPNLYTDEFKDFKFLKSSHDQVLYYRSVAANLSKIRPSKGAADPEFIWPCRLEFLEQLIDLQDDEVHIVFPGILNAKNDFESASVVTVEKPVILNGNPMIQKCQIVSDISIMESPTSRLYLAESNGARNGHKYVFALNTLPLVPYSKADSYAALFYDKKWALIYSTALTKHLRYLNDAVSSFTRLI